ncbi:quaternary ammonium compound-resistance protein SugE [Paraburkholderia sp. BL8N3]|nr:quaternary ammonium compound-resistance protein SugE [Paraburkholderia sp. BL8N3]
MAWILLLGAGAIEIGMAVALRYADGWSRPVPSVIGIVLALASIFLLTHALKSLPAGTAYAVWTGIGAIGVAVVGVLAFGESTAPLRLVCIGLVVTGVARLRLLDA